MCCKLSLTACCTEMPHSVTVVNGGADVAQAFCRLPFDHLLFTGSTGVGRQVMHAAADNLTPVTLELGGKSPVIIDESANIHVAARRIAWGKWLNAGQTCVAPDYILVNEKVRQPFLDELGKAINDFFGADPQTSESYGRIVSPRHFDRLKSLMSGGNAQ